MSDENASSEDRLQLVLINGSKPTEGEIFFQMPGGAVPLRLKPNGDIFVHERLAENDKAVVDAFREWVAGVSPRMRERSARLEETIKWMIHHPVHRQQDAPPPEVFEILEEMFPPQDNGAAGWWRSNR